MNFKFSRRELKDIAKAWAAITLAFGIVFSRNYGFIFSLILSAITVGIGFLLHELAHKFVAQRYNYFAEFYADDKMLLLAIAVSFLGFVFAAPGAVVIGGVRSIKRSGMISAAGPIMNLVLAVAFLLLSFVFSNAILKSLFSFGFMINTWLAIFNMLPFWILDGRKVWEWNKVVFGIVMGIGLIFMFVL